VALLACLLACDQQPAGPALRATPEFAGAKLDKNQVLRYQDHYATSWTDSRSSLRATHTTFPIPDFDDSPETNCGPQSELALIDVQQVGVVNLEDFFLSDLHL